MLHQVDEVDLLESGLRGDRRFYLIGESGRLINNKDSGPLQLVWSNYDESADTLTMRFDEGHELTAEVERGEEVPTRFHSHPRQARLVNGPWADALSFLLGETVRLVEPASMAADRGRSGAASLLATSSLAALASQLGVESVDPHRFRMNFGIEGVPEHAEDEWLGRRVQVGEAVVIPQGNVGRCVVTTQSPETGLTDLDTLKGIAAYRRDIETTEPLPFGIHAAVVEPGHVRLGDPVELV